MTRQPAWDTPEIASLRLGCAHPCAQTVPGGPPRHVTSTLQLLRGRAPSAQLCKS